MVARRPGRWPLLFAALAALLLAPAVGGAAAGSDGTPSPAQAGADGRIAFSDEDDVWVVNADGSGRTRLTTGEGPEFDPSWSPDGFRIAYRDSRRGINNDDEIYVMNADGSGQTNLTNDPANDWSPAWSPDGSRIAFSTERGEGFPRIFVMNADGSEVTRVTAAWGEYPSWSPDGTRLVYQCYQGGGTSPSTRPNYDLCVVNADGTGEAVLAGGAAYDGFPAWSPDGTTVAFTTERDACPDGKVVGSEEVCEDGKVVYLMAADGSDPRRLTEPAVGGVGVPDWSPDGRFLVVGRSGKVTIVDLSGAVVAELGPGQFPDWVAAAGA